MLIVEYDVTKIVLNCAQGKSIKESPKRGVQLHTHRERSDVLRLLSSGTSVNLLLPSDLKYRMCYCQEKCQINVVYITDYRSVQHPTAYADFSLIKPFK